MLENVSQVSTNNKLKGSYRIYAFFLIIFGEKS